MYFIVKNLRRQIEIPPDKFGKMIDNVLASELQKAVEGQIYPDFGAIVCVLNMKTINDLDGVLRDCVGTCVYNVEYDALVCRIFEKEVLRGQVVSVSEVGVDIDIGPGCLAQVHRDRLPPMLDYDVQESIYRDKDGKPVLHRNCNVRFEVTFANETVLGKMSGKISLGRELDDM